MNTTTPLPPEDLEHLVYEALTQVGWKADASRLARRLARLHIGLPREDELAVVCSWLGRCELMHKLDQRQIPQRSANTYQVPDLLAVFRWDNRSIPVLIEVKSKAGSKLSFSAAYMHKLQAYAALLRLPLLVAWKRMGIWTLFSAEQMKIARTNYNIEFGAAVMDGLLGELAGDFAYTLNDNAGVHLRFRKEELVATRDQTPTSWSEEWKMRIDDVYFTVRGGVQRRDLPADVQSLFFAHQMEESEEHESTHIYLHCRVGDDRSRFAHMTLVSLLNWQATSGAKVNWRDVATRPHPLVGIDDYTKVVESAIEYGVVDHLFHVQPRTFPAFMNAA